MLDSQKTSHMEYTIGKELTDPKGNYQNGILKSGKFEYKMS